MLTMTKLLTTAALALALVAGLATLTTGCRTEGALPAETVTGKGVTIESDEQFVLLDKDLKGKLSFHNPVSRRVDNGRLEVTVDVRNRTRKPVVLALSTVFRDGEGVALNDESGWQPVFLGPAQTQTYRVTSITEQAAYFTVRARLGQ
jgi:hypothetical protein